MKVRVAPPEVTGDTVRFRWDQSAPNPFQRENAFFFRYEGLDLGQFSPDLLTEIFLALQLRVFAQYEEPVELAFARPAPRATVEFWLAFHNADQVAVTPLADVDAYDPWATTRRGDQRQFSRAVFFGGGKDSMLTASMLAELHGVEPVLLIQFVHPLLPGEGRSQRMEQRMDDLILGPARRVLGFATRRVWTDYQAQFLPEGYRGRPHVELFTAGALPMLLATGANLCTFCYSLTAYYALPPTGRNGMPKLHFATSRPEVLATQTAHYHAALGVDLTVENLNFPFNEYRTFAMLHDRYEPAFRQIVMCMRAKVNERWCYACTKCALYAIFTLVLGDVDPRFDYERFFAGSPYFEQVIAHAESGVERTKHGVAPWRKFLCSSVHFLSFCHGLARMPLDLPASILSPDAFGNLLLLRTLFGGRTFPTIEVAPRAAFAVLQHEDARPLAQLAAEHFPIVDEFPPWMLVGNEEGDVVIVPERPPRTANVPHVRAYLAAERLKADAGSGR